MELTQQQLKSILNYDKQTGIFTWKISRSNRIKVGDVAGSKSKYRYLQICISMQSIPKIYKAHRLAWLYEYGEWPKEHIDHINHNATDNRMDNLREASSYQNNRNKSKSKRNKSGINGVSFHKQLKSWQAIITVKRKQMRLGCFKDKNEAICARLHANRLYGFHVNHGKKDMKLDKHT